MKNKLILMGIALSCLCGLGAWRIYARPPLMSESLQVLGKQADGGPVLSGTGPLGGYEWTPYLGLGWAPITGRLFRTTYKARPDWSKEPIYESLARSIERSSVIKFFLTQVTPLTLELEGRRLKNADVDGRLLLNSKSISTFRVGKGWTHLQVSLPAHYLKEGENELALESVEPTQWQGCALAPTSCDPWAPPSPVARGGIWLTFGRAVEIPVTLPASAWISMDDVRGWVEPGSAKLNSWTLKVRLQSGGASLDRTWTVEKGGRVRLPASNSGPQSAVISFLALPTHALLPGQSGLVVRNPRVESWRPPGAGPSLPTVATSDAETVLPEPGQRRPNILLYLVDTLRYDGLHCDGSAQASTPAFDALARDGVRFSDCVAQSSWTKAATASILTSLLPHHHQAEDFPDRLSPRLSTLASILKSVGYETHAVVTNPMVFREFGFGHGFDTFCEIPKANSSKVDVKILPWLEKRKPMDKKSFFLYLHVLDPHTPYTPPARFHPRGISRRSFGAKDTMLLIRDALASESQFGPTPALKASVEHRLEEARALYRGEVSATDSAFGHLVEALKRQGLYDNTVIVVVSDHGEQFLEHGLMNHMNSLYQELVHIPLIIKFANQRHSGSIENSPWQQIDIAPTLLATAGVAIPSSLEGVTWRSQFSNQEKPRPAFFSLNVGDQSERYGQGSELRRSDADGVRLGRWVLIQTQSTVARRTQPWELYDLATDPGEQHNLAYLRPEIRARMWALLQPKTLRGATRTSGVESARVNDALRSLQYLQ
jgi:arylsulfatase A-like enzyme